MWKFVARGIRETFERRTCRTNVYSQSSQDSTVQSEVKTNLTSNYKVVAPSITNCNKEFCGSAKSTGTKDKTNDSKWDPKHTWPEAVGWTGLLAFGWVLCQAVCHRRRFFENERQCPLKYTIPKLSEARISYLFGHVLNLQPKHVFPVTNCVGGNYLQGDNGAEGGEANAIGPITVEEALKEASDEFRKTHNLVVGEYELHFGIKALEEKRYKDAIKHFTAGAKLSSPASMFNLGLCYELGLGTLVDQVKAAKYYRDAAERGHADATYNLGVFHAQGRGGFSIDMNRARRCFVKAAELGQIQAQQALDSEKHYYVPDRKHDSSVFPNTHENSIEKMQNHRNVNNILTKLAGYATMSKENSNCKQLLEESKSPTETFLEFLGLNEPNLVPDRVPNDYSVPC